MENKFTSVLKYLGFLVMTMIFAACGGGGGDSDIGTLWVPTDVLVADIDGDSNADILTLAMASTGNGTEKGYLLVYQQTDTSGDFVAPETYEVGRYPWRAVLGDIDGDNAPDLVISDPTAGIVWLMLQNSSCSGQFLAPEVLLSGASYYAAVIADFNDDGVPDVAAAGQAQGLVIRYQDPTIRGNFEAQVAIPLPGRLFDLSAGDVDGDGLADVLAWVYTNPSGSYPPSAGFIVMYQKPAGGFDTSNLLAQQTGLNVDRLAIADVNADGKFDLFAFLTPFSSNYTAQLVVVPQTVSARSFGPPIYTSLASVSGIDDAVLADLDQDGLPDTAVVGFWPESGGPLGYPDIKSAVNLLVNTGQGAFTLSAATPMPFPVSCVSAGDLDGDGRNDIVLLGDDNQCSFMIQTDSGLFMEPHEFW